MIISTTIIKKMRLEKWHTVRNAVEAKKEQLGKQIERSAHTGLQVNPYRFKYHALDKTMRVAINYINKCICMYVTRYYII